MNISSNSSNSTLQKLMDIAASGASAADKRRMLESVKNEVEGEQTQAQFKSMERMEKERQEIEASRRTKSTSSGEQAEDGASVNADGDVVVISGEARAAQAATASESSTGSGGESAGKAE